MFPTVLSMLLGTGQPHWGRKCCLTLLARQFSILLSSNLGHLFHGQYVHQHFYVPTSLNLLWLFSTAIHSSFTLKVGFHFAKIKPESLQSRTNLKITTFVFFSFFFSFGKSKATYQQNSFNWDIDYVWQFVHPYRKRNLLLLNQYEISTIII